MAQCRWKMNALYYRTWPQCLCTEPHIFLEHAPQQCFDERWGHRQTSLPQPLDRHISLSSSVKETPEAAPTVEQRSSALTWQRTSILPCHASAVPESNEQQLISAGLLNKGFPPHSNCSHNVSYLITLGRPISKRHVSLEGGGRELYTVHCVRQKWDDCEHQCSWTLLCMWQNEQLFSM